MRYDALIVVSFGGPEGAGDVMPFLENVLRGKNVPRVRLLEVAEHYHHFDGISPIGAATRAMAEAVRAELAQSGPALPVYQGNRNWHPYLADTLRQMRDDGVGRALALVTSAFGSYSGCRQYREDIERARAQVGAGAPVLDKLRLFYNHPGFIAILAERVREAMAEIPAARREAAPMLFTAHSIPNAMAATAPYVAQLREGSRLVAAEVGRGGQDIQLAYQSRSGPPHQPWLEPDVLAVLRELRHGGAEDVVLVPIGFLSDHMEVLYDLDTEARQFCGEIGLGYHRALTAGAHPGFARLVAELVRERTAGAPRLALGESGPWSDECAVGCCALVQAQRPATT